MSEYGEHKRRIGSFDLGPAEFLVLAYAVSVKG